MTRWFDPPDGWKDRVQSVVCQVFGCSCRTAAVGSDGGDGEALSSGPSEAAPDAVPASPRERGVRVRTSARQRERVGVAVRAAPTTQQRSA